MNIFAHLSLLLAFIGYSSLASMAGKPTPGGDAGVGHAFALLFAYAALAIGTSATTVILLWKGDFEWLVAPPFLRNTLVFSGLIAVLIFSFFAAMGSGGGAPWVMHIFGKYTVVWALFPLLIGLLISLNTPLQRVISSVIWQWSIKSTVLLSAIACLFIMGEWLVSLPTNIIRQAEAMSNEETQRKQQFLEDIENTDAQTSLVTILVFTTKYQDPEVRNAALAKIKSNPQWQQYLVSRLQTPWAGEIFSFLADNDVPNKTLFAKPIETGVLEMAKQFEDGMRRTHTFYDDQFYAETEDILETIAKFEGQGINYAPAVRQLRSALDTPLESYQQKANLRCIPALDKWLKKHSY